VTGRDVTLHTNATSRGPSRVLVWSAAALALLAIGIAIGTRLAPSPASTPAATPVAQRRPNPPQRATTQTPAGAVAAAARAITAFDGAVLLDPNTLRAAVARVASTASRDRLLAAFEDGARQVRNELGTGTVPKPVIVLRSIPAGYRIEHYTPGEAVIAVWYVGIVGSGATVQPQQSWRTQLVTLVWEDGDWKVSSFESNAGPTPPLSGSPESPGELFASIPTFAEFARADP
jgi:hypothetical protein